MAAASFKVCASSIPKFLILRRGIRSVDIAIINRYARLQVRASVFYLASSVGVLVYQCIGVLVYVCMAAYYFPKRKNTLKINGSVRLFRDVYIYRYIYL